MLISAFLKYVMPDVPGCPNVQAAQAVLDAATEFLTFSGIWREVQDPITLSTTTNVYDLEAPNGARCIDIVAVYAPWANDGKLRGVTIPDLARILPTWAVAQSSLPEFYTRGFDFTSLQLFPIPTDTSGQQFRVHGVYTLSDTATAIPDDIVVRYREAISAGAKARLMSMPKQPWSNPQLAEMHARRFDHDKGAAKITATYGNTTGNLIVPPRMFGR